MEQTTKQRLKKVIEISGLSIAAFERKLNWSNGYVNNCGDSISLQKVQEVCDAFDVDRNWLISGTGEMFKKKAKEKELQFASSVPIHPSIAAESTTSPVDDKINAVKKAPLVPVEYSGNKPLMEYLETNSAAIPSREPSTLFPDFDFMYKVDSCAMEQAVSNGDLLFLKRLHHSQNKDVLNGNVYLIDSERYGILLRIVKKIDGNLHCYSLSEHTEPVILSPSDRFYIYKVVGQFRYCVHLEHKDNLKEIVNKTSSIIERLADNNSEVIGELREQGKRVDKVLDILNNNMK